MKLGPSFFKDTDPEFAVPARGETRLAIRSYRKVIIDNNGCFLAIQEENYHVDSSLVNLLSDEHLFDTIRELSQRAESGQEITISELTLIDVIWLNTILKNVDWVEDLAGAFPFERVERSRVNVPINVWVVQR